MITIQHIKAPNDINGNPRRLYLVTDFTEPRPIVTAFDEGCAGTSAVRPVYPQGKPWQWLEPLNVTPAEYKRLLKQFPER